MRKIQVVAAITMLLVFACKPQEKIVIEKEIIQKEMAGHKKPKNVIFMVGDGMGLTQITAAMISNGYRLNFERFHSVGFHKSYSYDDLITDSAAGATAFSIGEKSYNAAIGVNKDTVAIRTLTEEAILQGYKTGVVVTSTIVHATPASFIAHNRHRNNYEEIAVDVANCNADILIGGGKKYFDRRKSDELNLVEKMKKDGYKVESFLDIDPEKATIPSGMKYALFTADDDPLPVAQGRTYLEPMTMATIKALDNTEKGFFLVVEGSQIDWGGHANNKNYVITELLDFDKTIGKVLDYIDANGETLLVITADHETGGMAINPGSNSDSLSISFATTHHSGTLIPVFAAGPGAELFQGIYENTSIYDKIRKALGWKEENQRIILDDRGTK
ncbi:MAG: alkaline phosphatase [Saprospiraceae bacterium]|nr:alkaline phosphatase [Saprospiraceae bacterium]